MTLQLQAALGTESTKKVMVISHERSGTHFLMNTLAANFGYVSRPWINFDIDTGLNFHSPDCLRAFFRQLRGKPVLNIVKSHHEFGFFRPLIEVLLKDFFLFYIYRDPRDVMASFWRLVRHLSWDEGPRTPTPGAFARSQPRGAMLRYQKEQTPTIIDRWQRHVAGWTQGVSPAAGKGIVYVRYEDLNLRFSQTLSSIGRRLGLACPVRPIRPKPTENVVLPGRGKVGGYVGTIDTADEAWICRRAGRLMAALGYETEPVRVGCGSPCP